jgi:hypothetical protein
MTPDKNFRMSAATKTALALGRFKDEHDRGAFKRMMIDAQLHEEAARRAALKSKDSDFGSKGGKTRGAVAPD